MKFNLIVKLTPKSMIKSRLKTGSDFLWLIDSVKKLLLKSMAVWMVITLAAFQLNAKDAFPEEQKISLVKKIASLKEILKEVEKQSEFRFFYNHEQVDVNRTISVDLKDVTLSQALEEIFQSTSIGYKISGQQILLFKKDQAFIGTPTVLEASLSQQVVTSEVLFTVTGTVLDDKNQSVPGVNVVEK